MPLLRIPILLSPVFLIYKLLFVDILIIPLLVILILLLIDSIVNLLKLLINIFPSFMNPDDPLIFFNSNNPPSILIIPLLLIFSYILVFSIDNTPPLKISIIVLLRAVKSTELIVLLSIDTTKSLIELPPNIIPIPLEEAIRPCDNILLLLTNSSVPQSCKKKSVKIVELFNLIFTDSIKRITLAPIEEFIKLNVTSRVELRK